jgi:hypothetical protein
MAAMTIREILRFEPEKPTFLSGLIRQTYELAFKDLNSFTPEDFRILIGQQMYLDILLPLSVELLIQNPLVSGDYYEGDLLNAVVSIDPGFWRLNPNLKVKLNQIIEKNKVEIMKVEYIKENLKRFSAI